MEGGSFDGHAELQAGGAGQRGRATPCASRSPGNPNRSHHTLLARITITRTSPADVKTRQLVVSIDGEKVATLLWGESVTREVPAGRRRIRVHNTLVWKTIEADLAPEEEAVFEAINRPGTLTYFLVTALGSGPLYVSLRRLR